MIAAEQKRFSKRLETSISACLFVAGLLVNYIAERHSFMPLGAHSPESAWGGWLDVFVPVVAFYLGSTGLVLFGLALQGRPTTGEFRSGFVQSLPISLPLTALYAIFFLGMQFFATGADRLGECPGLVRAAINSGEITEQFRYAPHGPAVGCGNQRYGMFLSTYNHVSMDGVTEWEAQEHVLRNLADYRKEFDTHPIRVMFYEKENWIASPIDKESKGGGLRWGPRNLLRVVTLK
jgi:hypothetical protein